MQLSVLEYSPKINEPRICCTVFDIIWLERKNVARVAEWQTRRSQKPVSFTLVWVRLSPRAHWDGEQLIIIYQIFHFMVYIIFPLILLIFFYFFSSKVSPIPYFPTNKADLDKIIKALDMKKNGVILDLGAGDGTIIFAAATKAYQDKLNTYFIAIDINPILIAFM